MSDYENPSGGNKDAGCEKTQMMKLSAALPNFANTPKYLFAAQRLIFNGNFLHPITKQCIYR